MIAAAIAVLLIQARPASAFTANAGVNGMEFLSMGAGARAHGMGQAFSAVAEGPDAVYWNPAALTTLPRPEFAYTRAELDRMIHHDYYAAAAPARALGGALGFSASILSQDTLPIVDKTNAVLGGFRPHSEAFTAAYARSFLYGGELEPRSKQDIPSTWNLPGGAVARSPYDDPWKAGLSIGIAAKAVYEQLFTVKADAFAADAGLLWRPASAGGLSLSLVGRNFGGQEKFSNDPRNPPWEVDLGLAYDARWEEGHRLLPSFELSVPYYGPASGRLGLEYSRGNARSRIRLAWRLGYDTLAAPYLDPLSGLTAGIGIWIGRVSGDFSFQPFDVLGDLYRMSFGWRF